MAEEVPGKARVLAALSELFDDLAGREEIGETFPGFADLYGDLLRGRESGDDDAVEGALAAIYCLFHGRGGAYTPAERRELDAHGGYWCHAGGFNPLARAAPFIDPATRLADYGAGNGFQGLLFQHLYPHRSTTLIELSGPMVEFGKRLQTLLGIPGERVRWIHGNVARVSPRDFDFIYLYRPMRPEGPGRAFYEMFAREAARADRRLTIFSIADCLKDFLPGGFQTFFDDGHLTCFANYPVAISGPGGRAPGEGGKVALTAHDHALRQSASEAQSEDQKRLGNRPAHDMILSHTKQGGVLQ